MLGTHYIFLQVDDQVKNKLQRWTVVDVHKLEDLVGQTAVIVCNHQYSLDLFPLFIIWPICKKLTVVAKESLKYLGSFGIVAIKCGIVFINRKKGKESRKVIQVKASGSAYPICLLFLGYKTWDVTYFTEQ